MKKLILLIVIVLAACFIGSYFWYEESHKDNSVTLSGNVDIREVNLSFRVGGKLQSLTVDEGATVKAGQVLGQLDTQPFVNALNEAKANLSALTARKNMFHKGYRQEDIDQAKANLEAAQAALTNAKSVFNRQQALARSGASSKQEYDNAKGAFDEAAAQVKAAKQQYKALHSGYRTEEVEEVDANVSQAEAKVAEAELQLSDTTLIAPSDGIILTRAVEPGTILAAGSPVFTLSLVNPVWIRAYVEEPNLGQVAPGTKVKIYTDAKPDKPYDGVIGFVSPRSEFTPKTVETQDLRTDLVYRLRIIVSNPDSELRQGMPVTIKITG